MDNILELVRSLLSLAEAAANLPEDWNDEEQVSIWIDGMEKHLAHLIALLVPDEDLTIVQKKLKAKEACCSLAGNMDSKMRSTKDIDWGMIIDWLVEILVKIMPAQEQIIRLVGAILKQVLDLIMEQFVQNKRVLRKLI